MKTKISKVVVVYSKKAKSRNSDVLFRIKEILRESDVTFSTVLIDDFGFQDCCEADLILTVGGDGTFISASHYLESQLILGVNSDSKTSKGGLLVLNENNLKRLRNILSGKFLVFPRRRIDVFVNSVKILLKALNEVYFGAASQFHTSRYELLLDGRREEQRSSGILVVTATGSRAWYKSAGGRPFWRRGVLRYLVREPFVSRIFRSKLSKGRVEYVISFVSRMHYDAAVALDSNFVLPINFGDEVSVRLSEDSLNCVRI